MSKILPHGDHFGVPLDDTAITEAEVTPHDEEPMELDVRLTSGVPAYEYSEMVLNGREDARGCTGNVRDGALAP